MYINDIYFRVHSVQYHIELKKPIEGVSHQEIIEKARKEVEPYMFKNSIPGSYELLLL